MKRRGLRILPCGTPLVQGFWVDSLEFTDTDWVLPIIKDFIQQSSGPCVCMCVCVCVCVSVCVCVCVCECAHNIIYIYACMYIYICVYIYIYIYIYIYAMYTMNAY